MDEARALEVLLPIAKALEQTVKICAHMESKHAHKGYTMLVRLRVWGSRFRVYDLGFGVSSSPDVRDANLELRVWLNHAGSSPPSPQRILMSRFIWAKRFGEPGLLSAGKLAGVNGKFSVPI